MHVTSRLDVDSAIDRFALERASGASHADNPRGMNVKTKQAGLHWLICIAGASVALLALSSETHAARSGGGRRDSRHARLPGLPAQSETAASKEEEVRREINAIRQERGLRPLKANEELSRIARAYSRRMAREKFFGHTSPDGDTIGDRVRGRGIVYSVVGENLFSCTNSPDPVTWAVDAWMESPGHRENVLYNSFAETGVGLWREGNEYFFTQVFMRAR
jgi:uncharacterized protein YkwD